MSNLKSAKQAIQAELSHAQEGAAYYQARIVALEDALAKLDSVETVEAPAGKSRRAKGATPAPLTPTKRSKGKRAVSGNPGNTGNGKLPSTGKGFWPNLVTAEPQSANDILNAAIKVLNISPNKEQMKKLVQRQTNALHQLVKTEVIKDSGAGRDRRFFRAQ